MAVDWGIGYELFLRNLNRAVNRPDRLFHSECRILYAICDFFVTLHAEQFLFKRAYSDQFAGVLYGLAGWAIKRVLLGKGINAHMCGIP
ncbi:MAG: hypothetical protein Hens3KO_00640 [Henriciella sp.]